MMGRLDAQERLNAVEAYGLGTGGYEQHVSREKLERLRLAANGLEEERLPARKGNSVELASIGIGVRMVEQAKAENDG